eukprot:Blabericola_migrator_1__8393@NODE_436_length_8493_cov_87_644434_g342_i0_p2_GENE_NODE_436_length_8493_cov_87_644434_g342_i0NODE_436_length_8493_cov_87_644434_g342_i0_p2_ORF_typecomplete_len585_score97_40Bromodomain/PF00439_25/6e28Acetyltransf_1/PF00583_25/1_1e04Acetyltransf_1/PF00583_25/1_9e03Acetyltransf_1/PF00583_25/2_6e10Acetyltransf_10/PF13673_7/3_5e03Acetyltransf_10/PF13673_7/1_6e03Acetyltransf_10/PF13673_7/6e10Acetyltransf_7/PF13508_7/4_5e03Acetyltransf_7/PF13508_7/2_8e06Acetyltransf_9/PF13
MEGAPAEIGICLKKSQAAELGKRLIKEIVASCVAQILDNIRDIPQDDNDFPLVDDPALQPSKSPLLSSQLCSAINIQQWPSPEQRQEATWLPVDPYYAQHHARWKDFLVLEAQCDLAASDVMSGMHLRSLLMAQAESLLRELQYTALVRIRLFVVKALMGDVLITAEDAEKILKGHHKLQGPQSFLPSETGLGFIMRDRGGAAEEDAGIIEFQCITNDREPDHMIKLLTLKSIFSRQLPKMPREYIARLTFDRQHYSFCLLKCGKVIGGVCFRPFFAKRFAEIVFLAVTNTEQVKGYGTRLMNHLKDFVRSRGIEYFLTYADNFALGYFRKQGFCQRISMPKDRWTGYIKDYDGGTLMECYISPTIDYLNLGSIFQQQRRVIHQAMRLLKNLRVYSGAALWNNYQLKPAAANTLRDDKTTADSALSESQASPSQGEAAPIVVRLDPKTIPPFIEAEWSEELYRPRKKEPLPLNEQILKIVDLMSRHETSWPFRKPVTKQEAPDYHEHIKHPMDISTIRKNAKNKLYRSKAEFGEHLKLMFNNCRYYNMPSSIYYKLADELEAAIWPKYEAIEEPPE